MIHRFNSSDVRVILNQEPGRFLVWGTTVIGTVLLVLFFVSGLFKYPDIVKANLELTTNPAPVQLLARESGPIMLLCEEGEPVKEGQVLAIIRSDCDPEAIMQLEQLLKSDANHQVILTRTPASGFGYLQPTVSQLLKTCNSIQILHSTNSFELQIRRLKALETHYKNMGELIKHQVSLKRDDEQISINKFSVDSSLFAQGVLTRLDLGESKAQALSSRAGLQLQRAQLINNQISVEQIKKQIEDLEIEREITRSKLEIELNTHKNELLAAITRWNQMFLIKSPIPGKVAFLSFVENENYISEATKLFAIIPNTTKIHVRAEMALPGSGKVRVNQKATIRLLDFPFEQFGSLNGIVRDIAPVSSNGHYLVKIELTNGLMSNYGETLQVKQGARGDLLIVTDDLSLLDRIIYPIRKALHSR